VIGEVLNMYVAISSMLLFVWDIVDISSVNLTLPLNDFVDLFN
jgi:hypothetical protein